MSKFFDDTMQGLLEAAVIEQENKYDKKETKVIKFKKCPICGKEVNIRGGDIDWIPTYYDPDSGGWDRPYEIYCECGIEFRIGWCELSELADAWNTRKPVENVMSELKEFEDDLWYEENSGFISQCIEIVEEGL